MEIAEQENMAMVREGRTDIEPLPEDVHLVHIAIHQDYSDNEIVADHIEKHKSMMRQQRSQPRQPEQQPQLPGQMPGQEQMVEPMMPPAPQGIPSPSLGASLPPELANIGELLGGVGGPPPGMF
jgi:hypothetical protein